MPITSPAHSQDASAQAEQLRAAIPGLAPLVVDARNSATAMVLLHAAPGPMLIARRPPYGRFGESVLVAVDADPSCCAAAEAAAQLAAAAGGRVAIVASPAHDAATRHVLAAVAERVRAVLHTDPIVLDENGPAERAVAHAATAVEASLVVTGSRGPRSVGSMAERIARTAPCSVLVMRAPRCD